MAVILFGGLFSRDRYPPVEVAEVSVITSEEFALLTISNDAPDVATVTAVPAEPDDEIAAPDAPEIEEAPQLAALQPPATPEAPTAPEAPEAPQQLERSDVDVTDDLPPVMAPPTVEDGDSLTPTPPAPAPRVAPEAAPAPPLDALEAPEVVKDTAPDPEAAPEEVVVEEQEPAAPQEATTQIVTEATEESDQAPSESVRPRTRPARPTQIAQQEQPAEPENDVQADAIAAAVQTAAAAEAPRPTAPSGPPMTAGEKDALRVAVQQCWNVGSLSSDALRTTVVVGVSMSRDARPETASIKMLSFEGDSEAAARQAYEAARRAIIRCGSRGFNLPAEKFAHWQDIEMTFNPERMRIK